MPRHSEMNAPQLNRRKLLGGMVGVAAISALPPLHEAMATLGNNRSVSLYDPSRMTSLDVTYFQDGWYSPDALAQINFFMRDRRNDQIMQMDPQLVDLMCAVQSQFGAQLPIHLVSGYRSPATNAYLAARSGRVAQNSYHMYGRAADIRIPGVSLAGLRQTALALQGGGVGYYPSSDFVHIDNGPVRNW